MKKNESKNTLTREIIDAGVLHGRLKFYNDADDEVRVLHGRVEAARVYITGAVDLEIAKKKVFGGVTLTTEEFIKLAGTDELESVNVDVTVGVCGFEPAAKPKNGITEKAIIPRGLITKFVGFSTEVTTSVKYKKGSAMAAIMAVAKTKDDRFKLVVERHKTAAETVAAMSSGIFAR